MIHNKTIKFNLDKEEDRMLWNMLQMLPHGDFSEKTKGFWIRELGKNTILRVKREEEK